MSTTLERRTAKLEQAAYLGEDRLEVIVVRGMPIVGCEVIRASFGDQVVDRRADEARGQHPPVLPHHVHGVRLSWLRTS